MSDPEMANYREEWVKYCLAHIPVEAFRTLLDLESEVACEPYAKLVQAPTLVVHGTEDLSVPYKYGVYLATVTPGARLYTFHGHGHDLHYTATAEFCNVLSQFVRTGTVPAELTRTRAVG